MARSLRKLLLLLLLLCAHWNLPALATSISSQLGLHETTGRCGRPVPVENAEIMEESPGTRLRYSCVKNYKRKAGTSSLIVCKQDEKTKEFQWTPAQLRCIRDPSLPESTTEDSRRVTTASSTPVPEEAETSTPANPRTAGVNPFGSQSPLETASSLVTALLGTRTTAQEASRPFRPGTLPENATLWEMLTTTQISELRTRSHTVTGYRNPEVPPKGATGSSTQPPNPDIAEGLTGSLSMKIGILIPFGLLFFFFVLFSLRRINCFRCRTNDHLTEEIPMSVGEPEARGQPCLTTNDQAVPGFATEETQMLPPQCSTSTG